MTWVPGTYDPELNLYYLGTGNPNPVMAGQGRKGDNLWTCSIVALNPDTGKMAWYFQASPHDTHDWDAAETPVLIDGEIDGRPRKLLAQSSRNGYFFVLDRTNGKNILSKPFIDINWSKGLDRERPAHRQSGQGTENRRHARDPGSGRRGELALSEFRSRNRIVLRQRLVVVQPFLPHRYRRQTGRLRRTRFRRLLHAGAQGYRLPHRPDPLDARLQSRQARSIGILTTAGKLLFTGDPSGNFIVYDPANGKILWHAHLDRQSKQRADDLRTRRTPVCGGRRRRYFVRVHAVAVAG